MSRSRALCYHREKRKETKRGGGVYGWCGCTEWRYDLRDPSKDTSMGCLRVLFYERLLFLSTRPKSRADLFFSFVSCPSICRCLHLSSCSTFNSQHQGAFAFVAGREFRVFGACLIYVLAWFCCCWPTGSVQM